MVKEIFITLFSLNFAVALLGLIWPPAFWLLCLTIPILLLAIYDRLQVKHTLLRNFPALGRGRWIAEILRPPVRQYFVESDIDGAPISRMFRSVVYQRSKKALDTVPFGTQVDTYRIGYEWLGHSLTAKHACSNCDLRVDVGSEQCKQKYNASILNIAAMSYGSLSAQAVLALNGGAKLGHFAHNTGEGGISKFHLKNGGDLIWQIGTGYFGCRDQDGNFCATTFKKNAGHETVKMIEVKLSQGAKPGHGGILPAEKNTEEIAKIRHVPVGTQVNSPPGHSAFSTPIEMMEFIQELRDLSEGKPIGFKLCIGRPEEFVSICKAITETKIYPDFITIDGGEGGTGAAPLEYSNSIGMPLRDGLALAIDCLNGFDIREQIKVIASGKILTGFHMVKNLGLGADLCYSARGMMLALGCIQAMECNSNHCPTGVATQNPKYTKGLVVSDKKVRVANYHDETVQSAAEIIASMGFDHSDQLQREHIFRRVSAEKIMTYAEIFPGVKKGAFLSDQIPERYKEYVQQTCHKSFIVNECRACV